MSLLHSRKSAANGKAEGPRKVAERTKSAAPRIRLIHICLARGQIRFRKLRSSKSKISLRLCMWRVRGRKFLKSGIREWLLS